MTQLASSYTSTGEKFLAHPQVLQLLRRKRARPIVAHLMPTDACQHRCAFCSVQAREKKVLTMHQMMVFVDSLMGLGLKAVIISGGGNPLLWKCPQTEYGITDLIDHLTVRGLEVGMITNGLDLQEYQDGRVSYRGLYPYALDKLTWLRISCSGLDHPEGRVCVPSLDRGRTTLGFSYILHDRWYAPLAPHGTVSRPEDLPGGFTTGSNPVWWAKDRIPVLTEQVRKIVTIYNPAYFRLLPNCLEPEKIQERIEMLKWVAEAVDPTRVFVQYKPPVAPKACYLGYLHPVLNSDGWVYPCDSCVLNEAAGKKFGEPWRLCKWDEVERLYQNPAESLVNPQELCPGCVFTVSNNLLTSIVEGLYPPKAPQGLIHVNFV